MVFLFILLRADVQSGQQLLQLLQTFFLPKLIVRIKNNTTIYNSNTMNNFKKWISHNECVVLGFTFQAEINNNFLIFEARIDFLLKYYCVLLKCKREHPTVCS